VVALFPEERTIHHNLTDSTMRHLVGKAAPELEHLRVDVAYGGPSARPKYSAI
jgi:hypothetical protein